MIIERITRIRYGIADALYRLGAVLLALYLRSKKRVLAAIPYATPEEWAGLAVLASVVFVVALGTIVVWHLFGTPGATAMVTSTWRSPSVSWSMLHASRARRSR